MLAPNIRLASHSGQWYSAQPNVLASQMSGFIDAIDLKLLPKQPLIPKAIICPHAGYSYCGRTGAYAWSRVTDCEPRLQTLVILGPSHHKAFRCCALPHRSLSHYATPFGNLCLDTAIIGDLLQHTGFFSSLSKAEDEAEHSIEMQLPFLYHCLPTHLRESVKIVPIVVGSLTPDCAVSVAKLLQPLFESSKSLFVISSDFCHWGCRFNFYHFPEHHLDDAVVNVNARIAALDDAAVKIITKHQKTGFWDYIKETKNTICGQNPIKILLELIEASPLNLDTRKLHYSQSSVIEDTKQDTSVSYCSLATFYSTPLN